MVTTRRSFFLLIFLLTILPGICMTQDASGLKVVSSKNPDMSSVETVIASIIKPEMSNQEKAEALFDFLILRTYHHNTPEEPIHSYSTGQKYSVEMAQLEDAIKMLNVYGYALCGSHSKYQNQFYNAMGMLGRVNGANGHTVPEVKYDGKWHYFDVDMMGYVKDNEGKIYSHDEVGKNPDLLMNNASKWKFKFDGPKNMFGALKPGVAFSMYGRKVGIHSMNLALKKGEKITRFFKVQWAPNFQYYAPPSTLNTEYTKRLVKNAGLSIPGPSRDKTHYMFMEKGASRYGNWEISYTPNLEDPEFVSDLFSKSNIKQAKKAPFITSDKDSEESSIILNYYSPYGCAGVPGDLSTNDDDKNGFVLEGEFANDSGEIYYSLDAGRSWLEAHKSGGAFTLDLTPKLVCQYGWLIKIAFKGKDAGLKSLKSNIRGQLSPASLPFVDGETEMTFSRDDTACLLFAPDVSKGEEEFKKLTHSLDTYLSYGTNPTQLISFGADNNGSVTYKVDVPNDLVFVKAGATFNARRPSTRNGVAFSLDEGATWVIACEQGIISNEDHNEEFWGQNVEGVLDLRTGKAYSPGCTPVEGAIRENKVEVKGPVKSVLVKFYTKSGNGKLAKVAGIYAHYKKEQKNAVKITHEWEGGKHDETVPAGQKTHKYKVAGGALDKNISVTMEIPAK